MDAIIIPFKVKIRTYEEIKADNKVPWLNLPSEQAYREYCKELKGKWIVVGMISDFSISKFLITRPGRSIMKAPVFFFKFVSLVDR